MTIFCTINEKNFRDAVCGFQCQKRRLSPVKPTVMKRTMTSIYCCAFPSRFMGETVLQNILHNRPSQSQKLTIKTYPCHLTVLFYTETTLKSFYLHAVLTTRTSLYQPVKLTATQRVIVLCLRDISMISFESFTSASGYFCYYLKQKTHWTDLQQWDPHKLRNKKQKCVLQQ